MTSASVEGPLLAPQPWPGLEDNYMGSEGSQEWPWRVISRRVHWRWWGFISNYGMGFEHPGFYAPFCEANEG